MVNVHILDVSSQMNSLSKWFPTRVTFENFVTFMNGFDVSTQMNSLIKWFPTRVTFENFVTFMNGFDVSSQMNSLSKWFPTRVTFEIFVALVNGFDVSTQLTCFSKMVSHKSHICNLCKLHEQFWYVLSDFQLEEKIFHKRYIFIHFDFSKLYFVRTLAHCANAYICKYWIN